ncbi:MAG: glycosyltransferase family 4 protein [Spirochaetales bacterium]
MKHSLARHQAVDALVEFRGIIPHNDLRAFYQSLDVVLIPSLSEALRNVTHEALAAGRPVVTTPTGAAEIANGASIVVETASSEAIASAFIRLATSSELSQKLSRKARAIAESMSWKETARRYAQVLRDALVSSDRPDRIRSYHSR